MIRLTSKNQGELQEKVNCSALSSLLANTPVCMFPNKIAVDSVNLTTPLLCFPLCNWSRLHNNAGLQYKRDDADANINYTDGFQDFNYLC